MNNEKNALISESIEQVDTYRVRGSDFPFKPAQAVGAVPEGANQLSKAPCDLRNLEDDGMGSSGAGTPSVWGKGGKSFSVGTNAGEGSSAPSKDSIKYSVNFESGRVEPDVHKIHNTEN